MEQSTNTRKVLTWILVSMNFLLRLFFSVVLNYIVDCCTIAFSKASVYSLIGGILDTLLMLDMYHNAREFWKMVFAKHKLLCSAATLITLLVYSAATLLIAYYFGVLDVSPVFNKLQLR